MILQNGAISEDGAISQDGLLHKMGRLANQRMGPFHGKVGRAQHGAISRKDLQIAGWVHFRDFTSCQSLQKKKKFLHCFIFLVLDFNFFFL